MFKNDSLATKLNLCAQKSVYPDVHNSVGHLRFAKILELILEKNKKHFRYDFFELHIRVTAFIEASR